jgi:hypothetical protein
MDDGTGSRCTSNLRLLRFCQAPTQLLVHPRRVDEHVVGELQRDPVPSSISDLLHRALDLVGNRDLLVGQSRTRSVDGRRGVFEDVRIGRREHRRLCESWDRHSGCDVCLEGWRGRSRETFWQAGPHSADQHATRDAEEPHAGITTQLYTRHRIGP